MSRFPPCARSAWPAKATRITRSSSRARRNDIRFRRGAIFRTTPIARRQITCARGGSWSCCAVPSMIRSQISTSWYCRPAAAFLRKSMRPSSERTDKPLNPELENTGQFNAYGIPAISVPCGFSSAGLPVGLMVAGPRFSEARVLALASAYERATDWHTRKPPLTPDTPVPALAVTDEDTV